MVLLHSAGFDDIYDRTYRIMQNHNELIQGSRVDTQVVHAGYESHPDISQPIHVSTTFRRDQHEVVGEYTRTSNPNRRTVEAKIALLEGGVDAVAFGSGMAAINAIFEATLVPGSHLIYPDDCYHGARSLLKNVFSRQGIETTEVDFSKLDEVSAAIKSNTKLIWMETPSNPRLKITDIEAVAKLGAQKKVVTACDSTFATPLVQKPLSLGVDLVMHSSTKFFSGHSDILGGVVVAKEKGELLDRVRTYQGTAGAVPSPFDCWLLSRSIATLSLRVMKQNANAQAIAEFLSKHPKVERVYYPGLSTHPLHDVAKRQMKNGFGSVLSIQVKGGREDALGLCRKLQLIQHATSLGGVETLIEHRRSAEGAMALSPDNLLRISVGIEHVDDLIEDFKKGLS